MAAFWKKVPFLRLSFLRMGFNAKHLRNGRSATVAKSGSRSTCSPTRARAMRSTRSG
jgi:hypothetical protein